MISSPTYFGSDVEQLLFTQVHHKVSKKSRQSQKQIVDPPVFIEYIIHTQDGAETTAAA